MAPSPKPRARRRVLRALAVPALLGVLGVMVLLAALGLERRTAIALPSPSGPFAVGRTILDWTDTTTPDPLAPAPGATRELLVWIWYPATAGPGPAADYVPVGMRDAAGPTGSLLRLVTRDLSRVEGHSLRDADLSPQQPPYPVVILRAGASAGVVSYSTLAEDLASHGYVVVGFDAPYRTSAVTFPDGRVMRRTPDNDPERCAELEPARQDGCVRPILTAWTADIGFVLDRLARVNSDRASGRFAEHLDLSKVGVLGHSFGGAAAAQFCHDDARCRAGIDIDGQPFGAVIQDGVRQPFMFLLSDHDGAADPESRRIQANIQSIYDRVPPDRRVRVAIRGAGHFFFSDDGALLKSHLVVRTLRLVGLVGLDGRRQLAVTAYCVRRFLDAYLKLDGTGPTPLDLASPLYPEIQAFE